MADFSINGVAYQSSVMDGETQTFVLKRLLPAFAGLMGCHNALKAASAPEGEPVAGEDAPEVDALAEKRDALMPVARELAALSDADVRYILDACVDVTKRSVSKGVGWVPVRQRGVFQDQADSKFINRLTIAWHVLGENFSEMLQSFGVDLTNVTAFVPKA